MEKRFICLFKHIDREFTTSVLHRPHIKGLVNSCRSLFYPMHTGNSCGSKKTRTFLSLSIDRSEYITQLKVINHEDGHVLYDVPQDKLVDLMEVVEDITAKLFTR